MAIKGHNAPARRLRRTALCIALLGVVPCTHAARINYTLGGWAEYSDNIGLTESDPDEEGTIAGLIDFDIDQTGRNSTLVARGGVEYLYYTGNIYDDDIRATMVGRFNWGTLEDRFNFIAENYASYEPIDVLSSNSPDNQQQVNVFVTGVGLNLRPGAVTRARVDVRYNNYYAEESEDFNGDRYNAAFSLWQQPGPTTRLGLTFEGSQVEYDDTTLNADYRREDVYASYISTLANYDINLALGYSWVELLSSDIERSSPLVRGTFGWRASPRSTVNLAVSYQFSDSALDLISRADDIGGPPVGNETNDLLISPDIYKQRYFSIGYHYAGERLDVDVLPYYEVNEYVDADIESEGNYGVGLSMRYRLRPTLTLSCLMTRSYRDFDAFDREDDGFAIYLGLSKQFTRNWSAGIDLRHQTLDSNVQEASYDENAAIFSVRYTR